jgi:PBSX family phage terminase large subunit
VDTLSYLSPNSILKPYGEKAFKFAFRPPNQDRRINILEGAVRSAKTWAMLPKLLQLCDYNVQGWRVITGVSKQTVYNNVLNDLFDLIGSKNYDYNRQTGELRMFKTQWLVIGAKDEGSEKYVRGLTVGVAYGDEGVLQPPSFVRMLLNRMSPYGARAYFTTNPDSPHHPFKTELLDNKELRANGSLWSEHFDLDDNPNLDPAYKRHLKALYKGVYYQRFVLGLWVVAEGAIYKDCWSDDLLYDDSTAPQRLRGEGKVEEYIGVDCGVDHPQVYLYVIDDGTTLWVDDEYYWDSRAEMRQKTEREYRIDLQKFMAKCGGKNAQVIIPPEAASFDAELNSEGIWHIDADNDVTEGIKITSSMMGLRRIRVHRERCPQTARTIPTYVWDPKKALRGLEEPMKVDDDPPDALRYVVKTKMAPYRLAA